MTGAVDEVPGFLSMVGKKEPVGRGAGEKSVLPGGCQKLVKHLVLVAHGGIVLISGNDDPGIASERFKVL